MSKPQYHYSGLTETKKGPQTAKNDLNIPLNQGERKGKLLQYKTYQPILVHLKKSFFRPYSNPKIAE